MVNEQLTNPKLPLALGTNSFGWTTNETASFAVLDAFLDAEGAHVDTADSYAQWAPNNVGGESETILGNYHVARKNRDELFLATKVGGWKKQPGLSKENVTEAVEGSLRRLRTDYIDLYYAHHDDETQSPEELAQTFGALVEEGKIRNIGISNLTPKRQEQWIAFAKAEGLALPVAIQPHYSLVHRSDVESGGGYGDLAKEHNLAIFPYYSLAAGLLTGKYRSLADIENVQRSGMLSMFTNKETLHLVETLIEVAESANTAPATVALAWLLAKGVTAPIASARTPEQLEALVAIRDTKLATELVEQLDAASAPLMK